MKIYSNQKNLIFIRLEIYLIFILISQYVCQNISINASDQYFDPNSKYPIDENQNKNGI